MIGPGLINSSITLPNPMVLDGGFQWKQGTDVASRSDVTLPNDGNVFELTGTTTVDLIIRTSWQEGSVIVFIANESVTIAHDSLGGGDATTINLAGAVDFAMTADDTLTLMLCSITAGGLAWRELARTAI